LTTPVTTAAPAAAGCHISIGLTTPAAHASHRISIGLTTPAADTTPPLWTSNASNPGLTTPETAACPIWRRPPRLTTPGKAVLSNHISIGLTTPAADMTPPPCSPALGPMAAVLLWVRAEKPRLPTCRCARLAVWRSLSSRGPIRSLGMEVAAPHGPAPGQPRRCPRAVASPRNLHIRIPHPQAWPALRTAGCSSGIVARAPASVGSFKRKKIFDPFPLALVAESP
jgi:hypothetical protein